MMGQRRGHRDWSPSSPYVCMCVGGVKKEKKNRVKITHLWLGDQKSQRESEQQTTRAPFPPPVQETRVTHSIWCAKPSMVQLETERWIEEVSESVQQDKQLVTSIGTQRCIYVIQIFNGTIVNNNFFLYILHKKKKKKKIDNVWIYKL